MSLQSKLEVASMEIFLAIRGMLFSGNRHECPVCGSRFRAFTRGGGSLRARELGYCPRCNAKARHRRVWLHCQLETELFDSPHRLLHVSPKYCLSRRLAPMEGIDYSAIDLDPGNHLASLGDLTSLDYPDGHFDAVLCVHVLEHIPDDRAAIGEMWRVLRHGGWAVVNVPVDLESTTYEDSAIVAPDDRRRAFGEADHVRVYGADISDRLADAGFEVSIFPADLIDGDLAERYGLTTDEHVFHCVKPAPVGP